MLRTVKPSITSACCERGIAIVEFALFLPIIILIFMGAIASFDGIRASRQVLTTADTVGDLISRRSEMDDAARDAMFEIAKALLGSFTTDETVGVTMTSIFNDDGELKVHWSEAKGNATPLIDEDIPELTLPTIPEGESVVVVSVVTQYIALLINQAFDRIEFSDTVFIRPRFVPRIAYNEFVNADD